MIQLLMFTHMGLDEAYYGILEWDFHVWSTLCVCVVTESSQNDTFVNGTFGRRQQPL